MLVDSPPGLIDLIPKSPRSPVTHLVHVTGPFHDVLEGSLARDIVHQEDSLSRGGEKSF